MVMCEKTSKYQQEEDVHRLLSKYNEIYTGTDSCTHRAPFHKVILP